MSSAWLMLGEFRGLYDYYYGTMNTRNHRIIFKEEIEGIYEFA
jgi:hypothetical protein